MSLSEEVITGGVKEEEYDEANDEIPSDTLEFLNNIYEKKDSREDSEEDVKISIRDTRTRHRYPPKTESAEEGDGDDEFVEDCDEEQEEDADTDEPVMFTGLEDEEDDITQLVDEDIVRVKRGRGEAPEDCDDDDDAGDSKSYGSKISKDHIKLLIALIALLLIGVIVWLILPTAPTKKDKDGAITETGSSVSNPVKEESVKEVVKEKIVYKYEEPPKQYQEYMDLPDTYYSDRVVISKFSTASDSTVAFFFMGIPENFKQKIVFPVNVATYNQVANGSVVSIDYKVISIDGADYVVDVITNMGGI